MTDGRWLDDFIWVHHLQRYTSGAGHRQPFYYYLTTLPADFLPWTVFAVPALVFYRTRLKDLWQPIPLFLFVWFSVIFLFFSVSDTKRDLYLLPAFPPLTVFVACYFDKLINHEIPETEVYRWMGYFLFGILATGGFIVSAVIAFFRIEALWISVPVTVVLVSGGFIGIASIRSRQPHRVLVSTVLTVALAALSAATWILPFIDRYKSARSFAIEVNKIVPLTEPLYIYGDIMNDFNFYTGREVIPILSSPADVKSLLQKVKIAYLLVRDGNVKNMELTEKVAVLAEGSVGSKWWRLVKVAE
jgi:4-amino-4-deoxy-L-arabinose transferase-like glycosyltransferase